MIDGAVIEADRTNTIVYTDRWAATVAFYRDALGLPIVLERDWFVEFRLTTNAFVSVADAAHTSIEPGTGAGLTLSWRVADVHAARRQLLAAGVDVGEVMGRWGSDVAYLLDPSGNRIELWSPGRRRTARTQG